MADRRLAEFEVVLPMSLPRDCDLAGGYRQGWYHYRNYGGKNKPILGLLSTEMSARLILVQAVMVDEGLFLYCWHDEARFFIAKLAHSRDRVSPPYD